MIRKLVRQMLSAQILSALAVSLCLLVDNIMIGRFLKEQAMAAYILANPLLLSIGAIGTLLSAGVQVACGKSLGTGSSEETNAGYSSAVAFGAIVSFAFAAVVIIFAPFLARAMGAGREGELFDMTRGYLIGFSIGAPGSMGALVLIPFLQMAGQSNLLIVAVLTMTVADIGLDLLNALVFHGGMFGMGLASSVIMVFLINRILKFTGGSSALAAFAAITTLGNTANCITTGLGGVSLTLSGIFFHEEDRTGLKKLLSLLCRYGVILGVGMAALLEIFAPALVSLFIPDAGEAQRAAVLGLRLFAVGMIPCCINNAVKNAYQGTGRVSLTVIISLLEGTVFPVLAAFLFSRFLGTKGVWLYFIAGETLTLLFIAALVAVKTRDEPWRDGAALLLKDDFGVPPERLLEMDIHSMEDVTAAAERAEKFCLDHGQDPKISNHIALCIEEMASNTIQYGFTMDKKHHDLSVRLLEKENDLVLRFRDDCGAFDPVRYIPKDDEDALGIRLILAFARDARYTYALNLNNVCIRIGGPPAAEAE